MLSPFFSFFILRVRTSMKTDTECNLHFTFLEEPLRWIAQMLLRGEPSARVCVF